MIILEFLLLYAAGAVAHGVLFEKIRDRQVKKGSAAALTTARNFGLLIREENGIPLFPVLVERKFLALANFTGRLKRANGRIDAMSRSWVRLLVPLPQLQKLETSFPELQLRAPAIAKPLFGLGPKVSESVSLTAADGYQVGNLTGNGVKVAVVDLGFNKLAAAISAGELPVDTVGVDFTGSGIESGTQHGTGVAEHVLDMAPGVKLYCLKVNDQLDLQNAADYLANNNIHIANHSVGWVLSSYYDDTGPINGIFNDSFDNDGVFWVVSAGNDAKRHWRGNWQDANANDFLEFSAGTESLQLQDSATTLQVFLNWNQYGVNNKTDLDLHLVDTNGITVASSTLTQTRFNDPVEAISFVLQAGKGPYSIQVERKNGTAAGLDITLFTFTHEFDAPVTASSMMDPANAHGAFTTGAVARTNWPNSNPNIRGYSSRGPTTDGRQKPDLVAPDGTASMTYGTSYGTSFSSPTVAGAAALFLEEDDMRNAIALGNLLRAQAIDIRAAGVDTDSGYGKLQLPLIDSDGEGLNNVEEIALGTNALLADTDNDGLNDFEEDRTWNTDPLAGDSDGDGLNDYAEAITLGTNPLVSNLGDLAPRGAPNDSFDTGDLVVLTRLISGAATATQTEVILGDMNSSNGLDAGDLALLIRMIQGL